jgi:hypothetical protein
MGRAGDSLISTTPASRAGEAAATRLDLTPLLDGNLRQQLMTANALKLFSALPL